VVEFLGLRLAALGSLWQNDFAVSPVFHNLSGHPRKRQKEELSVTVPRQSAASCPPQLGGGGSSAVCRQPPRGSTFGCFSDFLILFGSWL
jgi:hypothetical protein